MSPTESEKGLIRQAAIHIRREEPLKNRRQLGVANGSNQFASKSLVLIAATPKQNLVAFFPSDLCSKQSNVADVMLRARVRAASDMEINGLFDLEFRIEQIGQFDGMCLGVGRGIATSAISGACNGPACQRSGL